MNNIYNFYDLMIADTIKYILSHSNNGIIIFNDFFDINDDKYLYLLDICILIKNLYNYSTIYLPINRIKYYKLLKKNSKYKNNKKFIKKITKKNSKECKYKLYYQDYNYIWNLNNSNPLYTKDICEKIHKEYYN